MGPHRGPVRGGRFPTFRGNILIFPAFRSFFFPIFRFPRLPIVFLGFSGFPQLSKRVFRFPQLLKRVFRFPQIFLSFSFPAFRNLKMPFSGFRQSSFFRAGYFGLFRFTATFFRAFPPYILHTLLIHMIQYFYMYHTTLGVYLHGIFISFVAPELKISFQIRNFRLLVI